MTLLAQPLCPSRASSAASFLGNRRHSGIVKVLCCCFHLRKRRQVFCSCAVDEVLMNIYINKKNSTILIFVLSSLTLGDYLGTPLGHIFRSFGLDRCVFSRCNSTSSSDLCSMSRI
jgi:hypothetical protein